MSSIKQIANDLKKNCSQYLRLLNKHDYNFLLFRGSDDYDDLFNKIKPTKDRRPLSMKRHYQKIFDKEFQKNWLEGEV